MPHSANAPTPDGMRSSQRAKPKSAAIAATDVAKISRNMWSIACATLSSSDARRGKGVMRKVSRRPVGHSTATRLPRP